MLPTRKRPKYRFGTTTLLLLAWWFTSVTGTLINKKVMKQFPYPIAFTSLHLFVGSILDYIIISNKKPSSSKSISTLKPTSANNKDSSFIDSFKFHFEYFKVCMFNGLFFSMAKYLTYLSYRQVPVSLTHTIKSMSPVFSVISQLLIFQHCVPISELLTLIPIIIGVTLSTINEIHFELIGFLAAMASTILGVAQNTTSKYILTHNKEKKSDKLIISPMQLHMYGSLLSLIFLIPLSIYSEGAKIYNMEHDSGHIPYKQMLMSCCWLYGQTMASLFLLKRVTTVTHNVANTCKRFWIIVISIIYFKQETTIFNVIGIILALTGFFLYQRMHKINNKKSLKNRLEINYIKNNSKRRGSNSLNKHKNGLIHHRNQMGHDVDNHNLHNNDDDDIELGDTVPLINRNLAHDQ